MSLPDSNPRNAPYICGDCHHALVLHERGEENQVAACCVEGCTCGHAGLADQICAYCAERATHRVTGLDDHGRILGVGYCCSEPTHWAWLVDSVEQLEREDGPET